MQLFVIERKWPRIQGRVLEKESKECGWVGELFIDFAWAALWWLGDVCICNYLSPVIYTFLSIPNAWALIFYPEKSIK